CFQPDLTDVLPPTSRGPFDRAIVTHLPSGTMPPSTEPDSSMVRMVTPAHPADNPLRPPDRYGSPVPAATPPPRRRAKEGVGHGHDGVARSRRRRPSPTTACPSEPHRGCRGRGVGHL